MTREEVFKNIEEQRARQDSLWPNREQYKISAPHVLVLQGQMRKLNQEWYESKRDALVARFLSIATVAVRALEEIDPES